MPHLLVVRATVPDESKRAAFDAWYSREHLPDAVKSFGSNVVYAAAQNFGNLANRVFGRAPGPIPARPFLPVSADGRTLEPVVFWSQKVAEIAHWLKTGELPT